jgi:type IV pilus assembly protein PilM
MAIDLKNIFSSLKKGAEARPSKVVGIDFGTSSVKVVEVELRDAVLALTTYGELQTGPYVGASLGSVSVLPAEKRIEALVDIMREAGVEAKSGALALPLAQSFVTVMELSAKKGEDITPRVPVEARKYIPVPITDVVLEWTEIPHDGEAEALSREILLAAIQNEGLSEMKALLGAVQMATQPFEIELFSTLRSLTKEDDTSLVVIDVGAHMSKLYISKDGFLRRIHRVRAGGVNATEAIAHVLSLSFEDAENAKRNYTPTHPSAQAIKQAYLSVFERPFQEFKRVISQYETRTGERVGRVVITGGSALFNDFILYTSYMLDHETELATPFNKIAYPAFMEDMLTEIGPIFAPALGAALRSFE